jgi:hypothetical protein
MRKTKKFIAIIAVVVVLSLSLAAFALAEMSLPSVSMNRTTAARGDTVEFTINANSDSLRGRIDVSSNLVYDGFRISSNTMNVVREDGFAALDVEWITYVYKVAADAVVGDTYSFRVYNIVGADADDNEEELGDTAPRIGTVIAAPVVSIEPPASPVISPVISPSAPVVDPNHGASDIDAAASAAPVIIGGIAVLVLALGVFAYVKLR